MKRRAVALFFILISSAWGITTYSQVLSIKHHVFTTQDGLPHNQVRCMAQDHFGFLWIASWDGLSCYDGSRFRNYYHDPADSTAIPYFEIQKVLVDKNNYVWILARDLCRYDRETDRFITYSPSSPDLIGSSSIFSIATDPRGNLVVLGNSGFERFDERSGKFITEGSFQDEDVKNSILAIDSAGNYWLLNMLKNRLTRIKTLTLPGSNTRSFNIRETYDLPVDQTGFYNFNFQFRLVYDVRGRIWVVSNNGLYYKSPGTGIFSRYDESGKNLSVLPPQTDLIWSGNGKGIFYYHAKNRRVDHYPVDDIWFVESFFLDRNGILWYGGMSKSGQGMGLHELVENKNAVSFSNYLKKNADLEGKLVVFCIFKDSEQNLWIGTKGNPWLIKVTPDGKSFKENILNRKQAAEGDHPRAILEDGDHRLWIGYYGGLLMRSDADRKNLQVIYPDPHLKKQPYTVNSFKNLKLLPDGNILAAGSGTCCIIDSETGRILRFAILPAGTDVFSIYLDPKNQIWFGANGKILHYDRRLRPVENIPVARGCYNVEDICPDSLNMVWLALLGGGICHLDLVTHRFFIYASEEGLSNNTTYCILKDHRGNLWLSTNHGISMFNPATQRFVNIATGQEVDVDEFNSGAFYQSPEGEMYFGGMGGLVSFYPDAILGQKISKVSPIIIRNLNIVEKNQVKFIPVYERQSVTLPRGTSYIRVYYSMLDFSSALKPPIRYRLEGLNSHWESPDINSSSIILANLKPGHYKFQVETNNFKGEWNQLKSVAIIIPPFFYQTLGFRILVILMVLSVATVIYFIYRRSSLLKQRDLVSQLKLVNAQNRLSPHFISNCLNAIGSIISDRDEITVNEYITEVATLMRGMIEYGQREYISLSLGVEMLNRLLKAEQIRTSDKFDFEIRTGSIDTESVFIAPAMVQPFVENSIRYGLPASGGLKGKIMIEFEPPGKNYITCLIMDNGPGWDESFLEKHTGLRTSHGIRLIRERLRLYNALNKTNLTLSITNLHPDRAERGTLVRIEIPAKTEGT
jgi:ligand-binding sensor domain-containing protein